MAYDIALDIIDDSDGDCLAMLIVRSDLYSKRDVERLARSYELLVQAFAAHRSISIAEPGVFDAQEVHRALGFSRGPSLQTQWPDTIVHQMDEIMDIRQDHPAVRWDSNRVITYSQLRHRAETIAFALLAGGVSPGARVAVLQEPTADWIASILSVLRIGAVYIPLDVGNPWERLATMIKDCQPSVLLVDNDTYRHIDKIHVSALKSYRRVEAAAILYTSGSTGTPKGIILKHEGFRNWLEWTAQVYDLNSDEIVLQQSSVGFDMSLIQVFTSLCLGGTLVIVPRKLRGDARAITELIHSARITYTFTCTSELSTWFKYGDRTSLGMSCWRRAITGGEPGVDGLFAEFAAIGRPDLRLFHAYGPTEISWTATTMELPCRAFFDKTAVQGKTVNIPVGQPLPNYAVYVLDAHLKPVPAGVQGEIYIGGPGVAVGYLNNEALNSDRFIPDLFSAPGKSSTLHRTGDLGCWGEDGELFIEGRVTGDTQIKLRGQRIDMLEVERSLIEASAGAIGECVVSVRRSSEQTRGFDDMFLVAHVLDRRAIGQLELPESFSSDDACHVVQLTELEEQLEELKENVILDKRIGPRATIRQETDFFHIGGTSILLLDLRRRIHTRWEVDLSLIDMFDASSLAGMARTIDSLLKGGQDSPSESSSTNPNIINWDEETDLPPTLLQQQHHSFPSSTTKTNKNPKTILLTGSTGFLGSALLTVLISNPLIAHVRCIAVRSKSSSRLLSSPCSPKITIHPGDLSHPTLGLSPDSVNALFSTIDMIIHNGADVSYLKTYASLRAPNVQSTKILATFAAPRQIPIHYISSGNTCSFAAAAGIDPVRPVSVARHPPPCTTILGYAASKWASEVFLEKLACAFAPTWEIYIHRPSNISRTRQGHDGKDEISENLDLVDNIIRYSRRIGGVPCMSGGGGGGSQQHEVQGALDSVPLDKVVQGVVSAVVGPTERAGQAEQDNIKFLHHLGGVDLVMDDLSNWVGIAGTNSEGEETNMEVMDLAEWTDRAVKMGMNPVLAAFLQSFGSNTASGMVFPRLVN
ncbi:putative beta-ketoacyl synthase domain-containing protein [Rhypophila decipiens]|uniref:Beta-ketoacyl synthase domain-containing protein n=1 Tax=Rhypophila decipiens TaxID=261697 RepID=A0AAN6Y2Z0_9PEZI|nr:putative beta-ketoacyl synthase domain-containing protein [Rhypophila decipiens]